MIMKRFKTIGIITNYYFDYDMECYVYDLAILMNGHFVKNKYYTYDDEDAAIFSKEILEKFKELNSWKEVVYSGRHYIK